MAEILFSSISCNSKKKKMKFFSSRKKHTFGNVDWFSWLFSTYTRIRQHCKDYFLLGLRALVMGLCWERFIRKSSRRRFISGITHETQLQWQGASTTRLEVGLQTTDYRLQTTTHARSNTLTRRAHYKRVSFKIK